jgi:hypothetical protein
MPQYQYGVGDTLKCIDAEGTRRLEADHDYVVAALAALGEDEDRPGYRLEGLVGRRGRAYNGAYEEYRFVRVGGFIAVGASVTLNGGEDVWEVVNKDPYLDRWQVQRGGVSVWVDQDGLTFVAAPTPAKDYYVNVGGAPQNGDVFYAHHNGNVVHIVNDGEDWRTAGGINGLEGDEHALDEPGYIHSLVTKKDYERTLLVRDGQLVD